jgi:hypothetical protein
VHGGVAEPARPLLGLMGVVAALARAIEQEVRLLVGKEGERALLEAFQREVRGAGQVPTRNVPTRNLPTRNLPTRNLPTRNVPTRNVPTRKVDRRQGFGAPHAVGEPVRTWFGSLIFIGRSFS